MDPQGDAAESPIAFDKTLTRVAFTLENRAGDAHTTVLAMASPGAGDRWEIREDGRRIEVKPDANSEYPLRAELPMSTRPAKVEMIRVAAAK